MVEQPHRRKDFHPSGRPKKGWEDVLRIRVDLNQIKEIHPYQTLPNKLSGLADLTTTTGISLVTVHGQLSGPLRHPLLNVFCVKIYLSANLLGIFRSLSPIPAQPGSTFSGRAQRLLFCYLFLQADPAQSCATSAFHPRFSSDIHYDLCMVDYRRI